MIIAAHIGFHATDADQLAASLHKSERIFKREGIAMPPTDTYAQMLVDTMKQVRDAPASQETEDMLLSAMLGGEEPARLILTYDKLTCAISNVFLGGELYARVPEKLTWLRNCFPSHQVEVFMAIRNPAAFIPALMKLPKPEIPYGTLLHEANPEALSWARTVAAIRTANPDLPLTIWAYEDVPLIWTDILREVAGLPPMSGVMGSFDAIRPIMEPEGIARLRAYLRDNEVETEVQMRRILTAFLEKYAIPDAIEDEIDLPGWDMALIDRLSEAYEEDLVQIGRMPGVTMIAP